MTLSELSSSSLVSCADILTNITKGDIREDDLLTLGELPLDSERQLYTAMREHILEMAGDPVLSLLELREEDQDQDNLSVTMLVNAARFKNNVKVSILFIHSIICIIGANNVKIVEHKTRICQNSK